MDRALKLQNLLSKNGKVIVNVVERELSKLEKEDNIFYYLAVGVKLIITSERISIHLILPEKTSVSNLFFVYEFKNELEDRHLTQNSVSVYLVNHDGFSHEIDKDVDSYDEYFESDSYSVVRFYFR